MATVTLTDFLLARIAEDEAVARARADSSDIADGTVTTSSQLTIDVDIYGDPTDWICITRHRVLAECEAKRRIAERHPGATATDECPGCGAWLDGTWCTPPGTLCPELADLAAVYAEHPDYDEAWRP